MSHVWSFSRIFEYGKAGANERVYRRTGGGREEGRPDLKFRRGRNFLIMLIISDSQGAIYDEAFYS